MTTNGRQVVTTQALDAALRDALPEVSGASPATAPDGDGSTDRSAAADSAPEHEPGTGPATPAGSHEHDGHDKHDGHDGHDGHGPEQPEAAHVGQPDFTGVSTVTYAPHDDGLPDPGEVVWTWVAYEEDLTRGKDRPVLVVGHDGAHLLALMLTSRDHDGPGSDQADEERFGRFWLDLGPGAWDTRGRPSQVRLDRVLRVDPAGVRREGATLEADRFELVAQRLREAHGWA